MDQFRIGDLVTVKGEGLCLIIAIEPSVIAPEHLKNVVQDVYYVFSGSHRSTIPRFASELMSV